MLKIIIGLVGILSYKYLPRIIPFIPLGVSKAVLCAIMIAAYLIYDKKLRERLSERFSYIKFSLFGVALWLIQTMIMSLVLTFIMSITGYEVPLIAKGQASMAPWLYILIAVILGPLAEEVLFRGLLQDGLMGISDKKEWKIIAIIITSIFFGLLHTIPAQRISAIITGCVFGFVYWKKKDIRYGCMLHIGNNFMATALSYAIAAMII